MVHKSYADVQGFNLSRNPGYAHRGLDYEIVSKEALMGQYGSLAIIGTSDDCRNRFQLSISIY